MTVWLIKLLLVMLKIKWANKELFYSTVLWIVVREDGKEKYNPTGNLFAEFTIHTYPHAHTRTSFSITNCSNQFEDHFTVSALRAEACFASLCVPTHHLVYV